MYKQVWVCAISLFLGFALCCLASVDATAGDFVVGVGAGWGASDDAEAEWIEPLVVRNPYVDWEAWVSTKNAQPGGGAIRIANPYVESAWVDSGLPFWQDRPPQMIEPASVVTSPL